jgi:predicted GIY-YIG superfamily endonuclease
MPYYYTSESSASDDDAFDDAFDSDDAPCYRCGRQGHMIDECYAKTHVDGRSLKQNEGRSNKRHKPMSSAKAGVYVLGDENGRMYVGKSQDVEKRVEQHLAGEGTQFLTGSKVRRLEVGESGSEVDLESWERNETLARMYKHGVANVRGWMFTSVRLREEQEEQAFGQICEKYDLCRKCGRNTHFADRCFARSRASWAGGRW